MRFLLTTILVWGVVASVLLVLGPTLSSSPDGSPPSQHDLELVLATSPFRSDAWLALASIGHDPAAERALGAAYIVGGGKIEDVPIRLRLAVLSGAFQTEALHEFVEADVSLIVHRVPTLRPLLLELEAKADAKTRVPFDALLRDVDPTLRP